MNAVLLTIAPAVDAFNGAKGIAANALIAMTSTVRRRPGHAFRGIARSPQGWRVARGQTRVPLSSAGTPAARRWEISWTPHPRRTPLPDTFPSSSPGAGQSDWLMTVMVVFLLVTIRVGRPVST